MISDKAKTYWDGVPENLKNLCLLVDGESDFSPELVFRWLRKHMYDNDEAQNHTSSYQVMVWIDRAIESVMFGPANEDAWEKFRDEIAVILHRLEELLKKHAPDDCLLGHRTEYDEYHDIDYIGIAQRLEVYFVFLYMATRQRDGFSGRLSRVLNETKVNTKYLLTLHNAEGIIEQDDFDDEYHYASLAMDRWIPLNFLTRGWLPNRMGKMGVAKALEDFAEFLLEQPVPFINSKARFNLRYRIENRLRNMCELVIEDIEEGYDDEELNADLADAFIKEYEQMIEASICRDIKIISGANNDENDWDVELSSETLHEQWAPFSQRLRALMREYPTMPVVLPCRAEEADCSVAYVHDHAGKNKEKVIAIQIKN